MNPDPTSLDALNDIVLPPPVPAWPPAPGWFVLFAIVLIGFLWWSWRAWKTWKAKAYRRAAHRELALAQTVPAIAALLRRTALACAPRSEIADLVGEPWVDWLVAHSSVVPTDAVRMQLTDGIYAQVSAPAELESLRDYAGRWIVTHQIQVGEE